MNIEVSPVKHTKDGILVEISYEAAKHLGIGPKSKIGEVFVIPTQTTVQIASGKPLVDTPILTENDKFQKHKI